MARQHSVTTPGSGSTSPEGRLAVDRSVLEGLAPAWDDLSVAASRPYSAPGWTLPWWDVLRPAVSRLHTVTVSRGPELVGIAPLCLTRDPWRVVTGNSLGHDTASFLEPLARPGQEDEVAASMAETLGGRGSPVDVFSLAGVPEDSPWPRLLREHWPGPRPRQVLNQSMPAPFVDLPTGGFDEWFAGRSRNFRQQMRSRTREFERRGGVFRRAESRAQMLAGLVDLERLHLARWADRGGSQAMGPGVLPMLTRAAERMPSERLQVWTAELDGGAVAAALFVSAGQESHFWLGGFDEAWSSLSLSVLLLVEAVRYAAATGCGRVSFGPGAQPYKYRLATGEQRLDWIDILPFNRRSPYVTVVQAPRRAYRLAAREIPPEVKDRLRSTVRRLPLGRRGGDHDPQDAAGPGGER